MNTKHVAITAQLDQVTALVADFEAGHIDPLEVPSARIRTSISDQLDGIEDTVFSADASAPMDPRDRASFRRQWGTFRLVRYVGSDDLASLRWALGAAMAAALNDPDYLRLRVALEMIDPTHAPEITH